VSTGNVFSTRINRVYSVSRWNFFGCHRRVELYPVSRWNILCFTRRDELYAVCTGDVFDVNRPNNGVLYTMSNVVSRQTVLDSRV
jgi:hypothetical protein